MIAGRNGFLMSSALTLSSLPLFPLGAVLFPGGVLPLRVFEVRYLDMIGKCHKAGAPFGVVSLTQGQEVRRPGQREAFAGVGTLATITEFETRAPA
jgi:Lon protease-like protein